MAVAREGHPHLPPGREPGPQSRRTSTGRTLGGCAAPAFVVAGDGGRGDRRRLRGAARIASGRAAARGRSSSAPSPCSAFFWLFARTMWRGARPRYATGLELQVERQELRRGDRVGGRRRGRGRARGRPGVHAVLRRLAAHRQRLAQPRDRHAPRSGSSGCRRRTPRWASASSSRCRPTAPTPTRATAFVRLGGRRAPRRREARGRARAAVGGAMRLRVDVDGEPLAPGAAVSGRVVVEEGGRARSLSVRLAFVERTESFEKVARDAGTQVVAEGDLADGAVVAFSLRAPRRRPRRTSPRRTGASAGRSAPASIAPVRTPPSTGRSSCSGVTLPRTGRGGRVAEGTRLLSEYGV